MVLAAHLPHRSLQIICSYITEKENIMGIKAKAIDLMLKELKE